MLVSFDTFDENDPTEILVRSFAGAAGKQRRLVLVISDETDKVPGAQFRCFKENEAAKILWDAIEEAEAPSCTTWDVLKRSQFNKDCDGAWRVLETIDYGIDE